MNENQSYKPAILGILKEAIEPMDVEKIRLKAKIGNWQTTLKHLLELLIEGEINGEKTSKSWIFWAKNAKEIAVNE